MITIVGCGPGSPEYVTPAATNAVGEARYLVGAERLLKLFPHCGAEKIKLKTPISETLDRMDRILEISDVTVLVTGDPGLYSLTAPIIQRFGRERTRIVPGISSAQAAFALLGLSWSRALVLSAHKKDPETGFEDALRHDPIAILAGSESALRWTRELMSYNKTNDRDIYICENITLPEERVIKPRLGEVDRLSISRNSVIVIVSKGDER